MTDRPILFSGPMVCALLDGRKTQTRRVLKPQPADLDGVPSGCKTVAPYCTGAPEQGLAYYWRGAGGVWNSSDPFFTPIQTGDRLWVRETWSGDVVDDDLPPVKMDPQNGIRYHADRDWRIRPPMAGKTRVSIHMPRWASRLTLTVTDVRVQRLQDIPFGDLRAEGVEETDIYERRWRLCVEDNIECGSVSRDSFQELWDSLNAARALWDSNPWVVAYTFEVIRANIDQEDDTNG